MDSSIVVGGFEITFSESDLEPPTTILLEFNQSDCLRNNTRGCAIPGSKTFSSESSF